MKKKLTYLLLMMFFCAFAQAQNVGEVFTVDSTVYKLEYRITDTVPKTCTLIGFDQAPYFWIHLIIPETANGYTVTAIGANAFSNDEMILSVSIPQHVTDIGDNAFYSAYKLSHLTINGTEGTLAIGKSAFEGTNITQMVCFRETHPEITPNSLPGAAYNRNLNLFVPKEKISYYEEWASDNSLDLKGIHYIISDEVIDYGNYSLVFNYADNTCQSLSVKLGKAPENQCSLTIPETVNIDGVRHNVTAIEASAFPKDGNNFLKFTSVLCPAVTPPDAPAGCFSGITTTTPLYVGCKYENGNLVTTNYSKEPWNQFTIRPASKKESYTGYSLVYTITDLNNQLCEISSIETTQTEESLTLHIVDYVAIKDVNNNDVNYAVTAIKDNAFKTQKSFSNFTFDYNTSLSYIGSNAIKFTDGAVDLVLPESVTEIADNAFMRSQLKSITVYGNNVKLGKDVAAFTLSENANYIIPKVYIPKLYEDWYSGENNGNWAVCNDNNKFDFMPCLIGGESEETGTWHKNVAPNNNVTPNNPADKIVVKDKCKLTTETLNVASYYLLTGASLNLYIDDGAQLVHNTGYGPLTVTKKIKKFTNQNASDGWYTISSPLNGNVNATDITNLISATPEYYDLYRYDEPNCTWQNYKANTFTLDAGRGYLYANANDVTLSFTGEVNTDDVKYTLTANGTTLSGFHLIGNPFTHDITAGNFEIRKAELAIGYYVLSNNGGWNTETYLNNDGKIKPGQGALIKASVTNSENKATLTIKNTASSKGQQPTAKSQQPMLSLNVSNGNYSDRAYVIFGEGVGLDKINHENKDIPLLYIPMSDADYAIAMMDESVNEIPVSFETNKMGEFTITLKHENCEFEELYLLDKETGSKVNILEEEYTFMATSGDNPDRFVLVKDNGQQTTDNSHFAYINNGDVVIYGAEGNAHIDIYDVMGRRVYNTTGRDDVHIVSTDGYSAGVYVIRLMDENGLRTQKVVID